MTPERIQELWVEHVREGVVIPKWPALSRRHREGGRMNSYRVWWPQVGERPEEPNIKSIDPKWAAEQWCEARHHHLDYPMDFEGGIYVENEFGVVRVYEVEVRTEAAFYAKEKNK